MTTRNVTICLDEETARWARIRAAEENTSVSRLVGEMLRMEMGRASQYQAAMSEFMATPAFLSREPGECWPSREEIHDRSSVR